MRLYVVHTDKLTLYLITVPVYVNMSRVTARFHMEAMFVIMCFVRNV